MIQKAKLIALFDLKLTLDTFWQLTPYELNELKQMYDEKEKNDFNNLNYNIYNAICQTHSKKYENVIKEKVRKGNVEERKNTIDYFKSKFGGV